MESEEKTGSHSPLVTSCFEPNQEVKTKIWEKKMKY